MATAAFRRAWLGNVYRSSQNSGRSLLEELNAQVDLRLAAVATGQVISSAKANGNEVSYSDKGNAGISQIGVVEIAAQMVELYESAEARLIALGTPAPADAEIYAEMKGRLRQAVRSYSSSFQFLRQPAGLPVPS